MAENIELEYMEEETTKTEAEMEEEIYIGKIW